MTIQENIQNIRNDIKKEALKAKRNPEEIKLIAVTKTATIEEMKEASKHNIAIFAENRVQMAEDKFTKFPELEKHMIGHLQTNKVKRAVEIFDVIQSVDSLKLAKEINKRANAINKIMKIMIQVNIAGEEQKYGMPLSEAKEFYKKILGLVNLKVSGIMTIAPLIEPEKVRKYFRETKNLAEKLNLKEISMGMTNDYKIAIQEGATMVRIGRKIFN
ncbi:MAG: YggS family pyridoxal phosphate-dependent enzyme [Nanobdellota archaeon]